MLSTIVVKEFCKSCNWAYETWVTRRNIFDENALIQAAMGKLTGESLARLSIIAHEYCIHQIAKLHDPVKINGRINLTIRYIVDYGGWNPDTMNRLMELQKQLDSFAEKIRGARNRILSHNDLATIIDGSPLGAFGTKEDVVYFDRLQDFVTIVHDEVIGGPFPFNDQASDDAFDFADLLVRVLSK